ncbi:MAG: hypothetical protein JHC52_12510 [Chthoniobacterales bacterium]|nr:hypothetical protein [Chthoniobacterales bacterium]
MNFIRAEGFVFGHVADEGWMDACAGTVLRYRKQIGAEHITVWADVKKKHAAHAMTADLSSARGVTKLPFVVGSGVTAENAAAMLQDADAVIVGSACKPRRIPSKSQSRPKGDSLSAGQERSEAQWQLARTHQESLRSRPVALPAMPQGDKNRRPHQRGRRDRTHPAPPRIVGSRHAG